MFGLRRHVTHLGRASGRIRAVTAVGKRAPAAARAASERPLATATAFARYSAYLVTDDEYLGGDFLEKIAGALAGGVSSVQLRLKCASTASYVAWAEKVLPLTRAAGVPLIIDDRLDVALAVGADGLHVGEQDLPWRAARRLLGPDRILGCSVYGRANLVREALHPEVRADYVGSGSVFASPTKQQSEAKGVEHLREMKRLVAQEARGRPVPLVAIGGIGVASAARCVEEGADGVAVVSALLRHASPDGSQQAAVALLAAVQGALSKRSSL